MTTQAMVPVGSIATPAFNDLIKAAVAKLWPHRSDHTITHETNPDTPGWTWDITVRGLHNITITTDYGWLNLTGQPRFGGYTAAFFDISYREGSDASGFGIDYFENGDVSCDGPPTIQRSRFEQIMRDIQATMGSVPTRSPELAGATE